MDPWKYRSSTSH